MKTILTKEIIVEYVEPETEEEKAELLKIINDVKEEAKNKDLSKYKLVLPYNSLKNE